MTIPHRRERSSSSANTNSFSGVRLDKKKRVLIDNNLIEYYLMDPTGNITVLVVSFVSKENRAYIAGRLMEAEPSCEQVGYVQLPETDAKLISGRDKEVDIILNMSAGEFCGNATMSTAALFCKNLGTSIGESQKVVVDSSGAENPIAVDITTQDSESGIYSGRVNMPRPRHIYFHKFTYDGAVYELPVVDFGGISHIPMMLNDKDVIAFTEGRNVSDVSLRDKAEKAVRKWCADIDADGLGLLFVDNNNNYVNQIKMFPLVYIPGCDSCFWENSCGSGTCAAGAYFSYVLEDKNVMLQVLQPGGSLSVEVADNEYYLGGSVKIL